VQRVARSLAFALGERGRPITYDPYAMDWRDLDDWERTDLAAEKTPSDRGARWPLTARWRGYLRRLAAARRGEDRFADATGLVVPEIFSQKVAAALGPLRRRVRGPRVALFYDAIALRLPELTPARTVARFPAYLRELLAFDGVAAISEDSRQTLVEYWRSQGIHETPPVAAITLGVDPAPWGGAAASPSPGRAKAAGPNKSADGGPIVLCVAAVEGRKNHLALFEACERLWARGLRFELRVIGMPLPQTGRPALDKITALQKSGRPLRYDGHVDEAVLAEAYRQCAFTVYPSLLEGFGLPVIESLSHGRPCICSAQGALGEVALGGGCLALPSVDAASLAAAIEHLLADGKALSTLGEVALTRKFKTWADYARELVDWMPTLSRRPAAV
jgi:glycosyltransferase involved in cell wall biosynthesis